MTKVPTTAPANAAVDSSNLRNRNSEGVDVGAEEIGMHGEQETTAPASDDLVGSNGVASTRVTTHPNNDATIGGSNEATSTEGNASLTNDATQEVPSSSLVPGAYYINFPNSGDHTAVVASEDGNNNEENVCDDGQVFGENNAENVSDDEQVFEGFLAEPFPDEIARQRALELVQQAVTLDESAVRMVVDRPPVNANVATENGGLAAEMTANLNPSNVSGATENGENLFNKEIKGVGEGETLVRCVKSPIAIVSLTLLFLTGIALSVTFIESSPQYSDTSSCAERFRDRYNQAIAIVAAITPLQVLRNASSPQSKAMEWIVCQDKISSRMIDSAEAGVLPKQTHGAKGEDSGEAQVLRRYALATFFFATSDGEGGWTEDRNFLSENKHECAWHQNFTSSSKKSQDKTGKKSQNKTIRYHPFGDYEPVGFICMTSSDESMKDRLVLLDDTEKEIEGMELNLRIPNNLAGVIPPELGYITSMTTVRLKKQYGLYGDIPSTIGNLVNLRSFFIVAAGPSLGGVLPPSLFTIPALEYIDLKDNKGDWRFPSSIEAGETDLLGIYITACGLEGTIPSFISEFKNVRAIDLSQNLLEGSIPNSIGGLASLEYLDFHDNGLNGTLPQSFQQLSALIALSLGGNKIQGTLPSWIGNLSKLRLLDLSYNELEGGIPSTFSQLQELKHVSLQHNANLNGSINAFETLGNLTSLLLYSNKFSSTIPLGLFSFSKGPIYADFGHNNFTGQLPQSFMQHSTKIAYLATMMNNFDNDILGDDVCKQVPVLFADCSSCSCCKFCCEYEPVSENDAPCNFDLDIINLAGLECGYFWEYCFL